MVAPFFFQVAPSSQYVASKNSHQDPKTQRYYRSYLHCALVSLWLKLIEDSHHALAYQSLPVVLEL
jgi:hypothetical protein